MAERLPNDLSGAGLAGAPDSQRHPRRVVTIGLGLGVAIALIFGAWLVGGQQGFDQIGTSGINSQLLPKPGEPAPDFFTVLGDGKVVRLSDFEGQPVWLNFWGSWCPPCRSEAPDMQAAYEELAPRGLVMLAVSLDEPLSTAVAYAELNGLTYLIAGDPNRELTGGSYPIYNFPTHILIDSNGIVREVILAELNREQFIARAETILSPRAGTSAGKFGLPRLSVEIEDLVDQEVAFLNALNHLTTTPRAQSSSG